tara:strand:+ start:195 stop:1367 length:1173 start_codon:yes stop_codon:yes gene_type:complete
MVSKYVPSKISSITLPSFSRLSELTRGRTDLISLATGEPNFDTPEHIREAAKKGLDQGYTKYESSYGSSDLRKAIASKMKLEVKVDADPEREIVIANGGNMAVYLTFLATLEQGEEVLIPDPTWPIYHTCIKLAGGVPVPYTLSGKEKFILDFDSLKGHITKRTKMIVLNSPGNPTGFVADTKTLESIVALAIENDILIMSDEVYEKMLYDGIKHVSIASLPEMRERTVIINSFSKTYAMTGWRVGYAVAPPEIAAEIAKMNFYTNACPGAIAQRGALAALEGPQDCVREMVKEYARRREVLVKGLSEIEGISCLKPEGAFYAFPNIASLGKSSSEIVEYLVTKAGVITASGSDCGKNGEGHIRLAYTIPVDKIEEGIRRIDTAIKLLRY